MSLPYTEEDVNYLFLLLGKAVWYLQHLEGVMTTFNAFKILQRERDKGIKITKKTAHHILKKQERQTLGPLIKKAKKEKTIPRNLMDRFDNLLDERNWIIHKCVIDENLALRNVKTKNKLFRRIDSFVEESQNLKHEIYNLMKSWYVENGYDMDYAYSLADDMIKNAEK